MTVALATVWFTVAGLVGGTVTLRLSNDQYSPATPHRYTELQRDQTRDWRAHRLAEDQPLDLWIGSRRSISAEGMFDFIVLRPAERNKALHRVLLLIQGVMSNTRLPF